MRLGRLKTRAELQAKQLPVPRDSFGGELPVTWLTYATVWCAIAPERGREGVSGNELRDELASRITLHYRDGVLAEHRLKLADGRIYDFMEPPFDATGKRQDLQVRARLGMTQG